jgi:Fic family protein
MKKLPLIKDKRIRQKIDKLKKQLIDLYSKPCGYYTSELAERFDVEPRFVMRAISELKEEGVFEEDKVNRRV